MEIQFGIETEYGITRADPSDIDVVAESISLVNAAAQPGVRMRWDYRYEDPHQDARGFRVDELRQDTDEANYFAQDARRALSFQEIKSDYILRNGARYYNDHAHPEYCTPECSTLCEILQQDRAGDEFVMSCVDALNRESSNPLILYKNNTDFLGHSYGCHENYLLNRSLEWSRLAGAMEAFLVTRQVYCGSGKYGWEDEDRFLGPGFQISQRSDFFSVRESVDTMQRRPIVNTRDEPHADPSKYRRFHVIIGDANLSPYATWLKVGCTALVLEALGAGAPVDRVPVLDDPIGALKAVSRDDRWRWELAVNGERNATAISVQRRYIELVDGCLRNLDNSWLRVREAWERILDDLESEPMETADRLDWTAKFKLIESFRESEKLASDDPWLRSLDLAYHQLDREAGLFFGLQSAGQVIAPYPNSILDLEKMRPPASTRGRLRGGCIEKFGTRVESVQWDFVRLKDGKSLIEMDLRDAFGKNQIELGAHAIKNAHTPADLLALPFVRRV